MASLAAAEPRVIGVRLTLTNGKTVHLRDISAKESAFVAPIGGKQLLAPPPPKPIARAQGVRSDVEIADDVARRAKALFNERRRMDALFPHPGRRGHRSDLRRTVCRLPPYWSVIRPPPRGRRSTPGFDARPHQHPGSPGTEEIAMTTLRVFRSALGLPPVAGGSNDPIPAPSDRAARSRSAGHRSTDPRARQASFCGFPGPNYRRRFSSRRILDVPGRFSISPYGLA